MFINLLSNAIKYNRAGGTVTVNYLAKSAGRICICVEDTGAGLTPDELTQLFQPFNRFKHEENNEEGTGIGLVVCKRLVELMGGAIGVECTIGKGCVFWIELDRAVPPHAAAQTAELMAPANTEAQGQVGALRRTLLYVEDNSANLMLIEAIIARQPCIRLLTAPNGISGVEMALEFLPDTILMDIDLPDIQRYQSAANVDRRPGNRTYPGNCLKRECDATRYRERFGDGILTLPHQTNQNRRILEDPGHRQLAFRARNANQLLRDVFRRQVKIDASTGNCALRHV